MQPAISKGVLGLFTVAFVFGALSGCGDDDPPPRSSAHVEECEPVNACSCGPGTERATACSCTGGSSCEIAGSNIEFQCDGNAACGMTCGANCLVTCPGTTSCTVTTGNDGEIRCPGTASCDITCLGDCTVNGAGNAEAIVHCEGADDGAVCTIEGCTPEDCGDDVFACGAACPTM
jgi:hypothetical protein